MWKFFLHIDQVKQAYGTEGGKVLWIEGSCSLQSKGVDFFYFCHFNLSRFLFEILDLIIILGRNIVIKLFI